MTTIYSNNETININPTDDLVLYKEEFINSRIEKFLYAICALDFDDLPTPLSRIEELYKYLATGLPAPTFVPQSRVEKYLMAILGGYDTSALPAPKSRTEVLLNKILLDDTDLSDIEWLKSRYEFLLAYIAKGGKISSGSDVYYVDYSLDNGWVTLYNTIDRPVKNAVLKGNTLVNISSLTGVTTLKPGDVIFIENTGMKMNTTYTIMFNCSNIPSTNFVEVRTMMDNTQITQVQQKISVGYNKFTIKTNTSKESNRFRFKNDTSATTDFIFSELVILEGDYTNENIPYFEGIASVKMPVLTTTGKNLFSPSKLICHTGEYINAVKIEEGEYSIQTESTTQWESQNVYIPIKLKQGERIIFYGSVKNIPNVRIFKNDFNTVVAYKNYSPIPTEYESFDLVYSPLEDCTVLLRFWLNGLNSTGYIKNIMIEINDTKTEYEPHKSNILTCNEDVELCKIGDIRDELNLVTGELTQRVGEIVLDGSEDWVLSAHGDSTMFYTSFNNLVHKEDYLNSISCDKLVVHSNESYLFNSTSPNGISAYADWTDTYPNENWIYIKYADSEGYVEKLKQWLSQNPITVQYELATESVKTVDLSVVDQDDKETELSTFDDITHVITSSEGLVPTGDIDIARPIQFVDYSLDNSLTPLYNTIDYPVKNAVLRGQTLVNLTADGLTEKILSPNKYARFVSNLYKQSTTYTIVLDVVTLSDTGTIVIHEYDEATSLTTNIANINVGINKILFTSSNNVFNEIRLRNPIAATTNLTIKNVMILEGDYTNVDIPYFEGMKSVKTPVLTTTGKNLFNKNNIIVDGYIISNGALVYETGDNRNASDFIEVEPNCIYRISGIKNSAINGGRSHQYVGMYDKNKKFISSATIYCLSDSATFTTTENTKYIRVSVRNDDINRLQIEKGTTATTYEPHKSTTVSCNEEVELRGIGDIKDELNLVTGELVQKIGTYTFTGDENWRVQGGDTGGYTYFACDLGELIVNYDYNYNIPLTCNRLPLITYNDFDSGLKNVGINLTYCFRLNFSDCDSNNGATVEDLKAYLKANPTTVQYPTSRSVKTVDLSVVDQDGKETKLNTFDNITHVTTSSEGLVPTGVITVATKNATDVIDASVMSLRMDDILNSQSTLEGSANAQSDDIDVTMLGATDIYEQLL